MESSKNQKKLNSTAPELQSTGLCSGFAQISMNKNYVNAMSKPYPKKKVPQGPLLSFIEDPPMWFDEALDTLDGIKQEDTVEDFLFDLVGWEAMTNADATRMPFEKDEKNPCGELAVAHLLSGAKGPKGDFLRKCRPKTLDEASALLESSYEPTTKEMLKEILKKVDQIEVHLAEIKLKPNLENAKTKENAAQASQKAPPSSGRKKGNIPIVVFKTHPHGIPIKLRLLPSSGTSSITFEFFKKLQKVEPKPIDKSVIHTIQSIYSFGGKPGGLTMLGMTDITLNAQDLIFKHKFNVLPEKPNSNDSKIADGWIGEDIVDMTMLDWKNRVLLLKVDGEKVSIPWLDYDYPEDAPALVLTHFIKKTLITEGNSKKLYEYK